MKITQTFYKEAKTFEDAKLIFSAIIKILELPENDFFIQARQGCEMFTATHLRNGLFIEIRRVGSPSFEYLNFVEVKLQYLYEDKHKIPTELNAILNHMKKEI